MFVRKHPAPQGALRPVDLGTKQFKRCGQKAPSTTRCIKTQGVLDESGLLRRQKAPSNIRCIKTDLRLVTHFRMLPGQKAPSTTRCIKTASSLVMACLLSVSESTQHQKVH